MEYAEDPITSSAMSPTKESMQLIAPSSTAPTDDSRSVKTSFNDLPGELRELVYCHILIMHPITYPPLPRYTAETWRKCGSDKTSFSRSGGRLFCSHGDSMICDRHAQYTTEIEYRTHKQYRNAQSPYNLAFTNKRFGREFLDYAYWRVPFTFKLISEHTSTFRYWNVSKMVLNRISICRFQYDRNDNALKNDMFERELHIPLLARELPCLKRMEAEMILAKSVGDMSMAQQSPDLATQGVIVSKMDSSERVSNMFPIDVEELGNPAGEHTSYIIS